MALQYHEVRPVYARGHGATRDPWQCNHTDESASGNIITHTGAQPVCAMAHGSFYDLCPNLLKVNSRQVFMPHILMIQVP